MNGLIAGCWIGAVFLLVIEVLAWRRRLARVVFCLGPANRGQQEKEEPPLAGQDVRGILRRHRDK